MKARRERQKTFSVAVDKEKMLRFEQKLSEQKKTKSEWLNEKIDDELKK
nr:MAG: replication regulatory protein [Bacteriophage sp.]